MSFLNKLSQAVKAVKKLQDTLSELEKNEPNRQVQSSTARRQPAPAVCQKKTDFDRLLSEKFSDYEVRRNLAVSQIVPDFSSGVWYCCCGGRNEGLFCSDCGKKRPPRVTRNGYANIPYVLYQNSTPKLAVMLIPSAEWDSSEVVSTMAACKSAGIPCQRYFKEFSNRDDYVTDRIRQAL